MDLAISGKRALVTGGSSGLGLASAKALAAEGVDIVLFARDVARLEAAADEIRHVSAVRVEAIAGDMSRSASVLELRQSLVASGGVDILVLNSPRPPSPMRELLSEDDDERWRRAYEDQLQASLLVLRHVAPLLLDKGWGRIVAITSASVKAPMPRHALSTVFRAGVQAALKHLSHELGPQGVTVNSVAPATIVTPTFSTFHDLEARIQATTVKRHGTVEELAALVAFLASDHAGFITGQVIQLDGGQTTSLV
jgi:3-oxoacyl-[acyl-carrier protein] reductase